jgi:four helix bundle protein
MTAFFDHEKLKVYQEALRFYSWCEPILDRLPKSAAVRDQLDRARTSVALNIPEGNGKFTPADRCRFFDIARGSALERAGCLDLISIKKVISDEELEEGKTTLKGIVSMLIGLIKSNSPSRLYEEAVEYKLGD